MDPSLKALPFCQRENLSHCRNVFGNMKRKKNHSQTHILKQPSRTLCKLKSHCDKFKKLTSNSINGWPVQQQFVALSIATFFKCVRFNSNIHDLFIISFHRYFLFICTVGIPFVFRVRVCVRYFAQIFCTKFTCTHANSQQQ